MCTASATKSETADRDRRPHDDDGDRFNGGCIIDEQGHEIPITERMIRKALDNLANDGTERPSDRQPRSRT